MREFLHKFIYLEAPQNSAALTAFPLVSRAAGIIKQSNPRVSIPTFPYPQQILLSVIAIFPGPKKSQRFDGNSRNLCESSIFLPDNWKSFALSTVVQQISQMFLSLLKYENSTFYSQFQKPPYFLPNTDILFLRSQMETSIVIERPDKSGHFTEKPLSTS